MYLYRVVIYREIKSTSILAKKKKNTIFHKVSHSLIKKCNSGRNKHKAFGDRLNITCKNCGE